MLCSQTCLLSLTSTLFISFNRSNRKIKRKRSHDEGGEETEEEAEEFYAGNPAFPVHSKSRKVLSPYETIELLMDKGAFRLSRVYHTQPLHVEHHRSFIVDLQSLLSVEDVKCDDMGSWLNNSSSTFMFKVDWDEDGHINMLSTGRSGDKDRAVILKRQYFSLKHDVRKDVRKRIDSVIGKSCTKITKNLQILHCRHFQTFRSPLKLTSLAKKKRNDTNCTNYGQSGIQLTRITRVLPRNCGYVSIRLLAEFESFGLSINNRHHCSSYKDHNSYFVFVL